MNRDFKKAVVFDLGRVVLDFDHTIAAKKISALTGKSHQEIYQLFFDSPVTILFEQGRISASDFYRQVKQMLKFNLEYNDFVQIWNDIFFFSSNNQKVYNLAKDLKNNYPTVLLSNINILHLEYVKEKFKIWDAFSYVIASCQVGEVKPAPEIYNKVLDILGLPPQQVFYTDDRLELVRGAAKLGFYSVVYQDPQKLQEELVAFGIALN